MMQTLWEIVTYVKVCFNVSYYISATTTAILSTTGISLKWLHFVWQWRNTCLNLSTIISMQIV